MRTLTTITCLLALALATTALAACGGDDDGGGGDAISVNLSPVGDASQFGTATLTPEGDQTRVVVDVDSPVSNSQPAHIHEGTCADLNPEPAFGLPNVVDGRSESTVDVSLDDLTGADYAINLHMSDDDLTTYTSCGDIEATE
jgi:Cu/Zn superoxide dismutase